MGVANLLPAAVLMLLFAAAQGAVVFSTAYLALRMLKTSRGPAKVAAMAASYLAWATFTVAGYVGLGGEGGLMDGLGFVLLLCVSAFLSSCVFTLVWTLAHGATREPTHG